MSNVPTPDPRERKALAEAYVDGLHDVLELLRPVRHAWTLDRDEATKSFYWTCLCGEVIVQGFGEIEGIRELLLAHIEDPRRGES